MLMIRKAVAGWKALIADFRTLQQIQFSAPWRSQSKC
jgi:hypothetical protein